MTTSSCTLQACLVPDDICTGENCDTDEDDGEYVYRQRKLFQPLKGEIKKSDDKQVGEEEEKEVVSHLTLKKSGSSNASMKSNATSTIKSDTTESEDEDEEDEDEDMTNETRLLEKALFCLQPVLHFTKRISKGVYLVELVANSKTQCLKIVRRKPRYKSRTPMELRMLSSIRSLDVQRHIQVLNGFVLTNDFYAFLSNYAPSLHSCSLHKTQSEVQSIMRQLLVGLRQLHRNAIIHRDIKMSNILWDGKQLTIVDFDKATWNTPKGHHVLIGTDGFIAPEVWRYERDGRRKPVPYTEKCDIYSAGVLFGCLLFEVSESETKEMHASIFRDTADDALPPLTAQLLKSMLRYNPAKRASAHKLLQHPYFTAQKASSVASSSIPTTTN
jgi:hypothetical protein